MLMPIYLMRGSACAFGAPRPAQIKGQTLGKLWDYRLKKKRNAQQQLAFACRLCNNCAMVWLDDTWQLIDRERLLVTARKRRACLMPAERQLWESLKQRGFELKAVKGRWIVDCYHPRARVAIMIDALDPERDKALKDLLGITVLNVTSPQIRRNPQAVLRMVNAAISARSEVPEPSRILLSDTTRKALGL